MLRKVAIVGSTVALALAVFGGGTAHGAAKVDAHGSMNCSLSGKAKISPPLTFGGSGGTATFTAKLKSVSCSGSSGVSSFKGTLVSTLPSTDCNVLAGQPFGAGSILKAKYKGAAKYNPSVPAFTSGGSFTSLDPVTLSIPGGGTSSVPSGSFSGQSFTVSLQVNEVVATLATACTPKTKGLKGSGGLKKLSYGGSSNITFAA
jgi:hypothetical protein